MGAIAKTWNTVQLPDSIAGNIVSSPISYILNKASIGVHKILGLNTYEPAGGYDKQTFGVIQGVKNAFHRTFLPPANEKKGNSGLYSKAM